MLVYYIVVSWLIHRTGYEHSEALFMAEKIKLLFEAPNNTLLTLGTTFPTVTFLSSIAFSPFGYPYAPVLASTTFTTLLFYFLLDDFSQSALPKKVFLPMLCLLFAFHPGLIFAAVSGRGVGAIIFFFYLLFRSLFRYYRTQTTFYLSMASIYLTCLIFCDHNFIWLLLAFFPFIVLVSIDGLKIKRDGPPIIQYFEAVNITSQRRKLANRTLAIYVIVFLLPIGTLFLFRTLNFYHAGDAAYYLNSQYANWHVTGNISIGELLTSNALLNVSEQSQLIFQVYILLLTPLLILVFVLFKGTMYELFTLLAPFILLTILLLDNQYYLTVEFYLIFLILALIGLCFYAGKKYKSKILWPVIMAVALLNIFTGILYFNRTSDPEESLFFNTFKKMKKWNPERNTNEDYRLADFISNIANDQNKILMDDAAAYKVIAHLRSLRGIILPINDNFLTVVENPKLEAKYICVVKSNNKLRNFTVLNEYNLNLMKKRLNVKPVLMFETETWAVYKLVIL